MEINGTKSEQWVQKMTCVARKEIHRFKLVVGNAVRLGAAVGVTVGTKLAWQVARRDSSGMAFEVGNEVVAALGEEGMNATEAPVPALSSVMSSSS